MADEEQISKEQSVSTSTGRVVTLGSLLANLGLGGLLVFNIVTGKVEEQKSPDFKGITITSRAAPRLADTLPPDTLINLVIDSVHSEYDSLGNLVSSDTASHYDTTITEETIRLSRRDVSAVCSDGTNNLKFELRPGQKYSDAIRIDGILVGEIAVDMPDTMPDNCVHGLTVNMPTLTELDTTKTRWNK